jgi:hypothetical protein
VAVEDRGAATLDPTWTRFRSHHSPENIDIFPLDSTQVASFAVVSHSLPGTSISCNHLTFSSTYLIRTLTCTAFTSL